MLAACSTQNLTLDDELARAYTVFKSQSGVEGIQSPIVESEDEFRESMESCDLTNDLYEEIVETTEDFFDQDDWEDTVDANYKSNKIMADHQWSLGLHTWNLGIYYQAGMFYGRYWNILTTGSLL